MAFIRLTLCTLLLLLTPSVWADATLYLVRHAEKASDGTRDPNLTDAGHARAQWLAAYLSDKNILGVYSTDFKRTRQTAQPTAMAAGLEIQPYDPRALPDFARKLKALEGAHLVVGHSNTTPALASILTGKEWTELEEYQYDHIYVVRVGSDGTASASITYSEPRTNPFPEVAALKRAMVNRLAIMGDVARFKWNNKLAIDAPEREARVINATVARATQAGLDTDFATTVITAQMTASKTLQRALFARWKDHGVGAFDGVPSLPDVIRPRIDVLTGELIDALKSAQSHLGTCDAQVFFSETPAAFYRAEEIWAAASNPVLDPACTHTD